MPAELERRRLIAEANLDVVQAEVEKLEELRTKATEKVVEEDASLVLRHGPRGVTKMRHGVVATIDGQRVGRNKSNMFEIQDERSKYNGLLVHTYIEKVVRPWVIGNGELRKELKAKLDAGEISAAEMPANPQLPWPDPPATK